MNEELLYYFTLAQERAVGVETNLGLAAREAAGANPLAAILLRDSLEQIRKLQGRLSEIEAALKTP